MSQIHPTAIIERGAELGADVEIGPFCVVGPHATIGDGTKLHSRVTIVGHTTLGKNNEIFPNAVLGSEPQDFKYRDGPCTLEIGDHNSIREAVTIHIGTEVGGGVTRLGSHNLLMVNCHLGHDANFGSHCIIGNNVMIAGHVECRDGAALMGGVGVHHYCTIGDYAYVAGYARVVHDVPPFVRIDSNSAVRAVNHVGLQRKGFSDADMEAIDSAARQLFFGKRKPFATTLSELEHSPALNPHVKYMIEFLHRRNAGKNGRYLESLRAR